MTSLVAAEILKLRTTRTALVFALVGLGLLALTLAAGLVLYDETSVVVSDEEHVREILTAADIAAVLILLLAITNTSGEYRHDTITPAFLVAPRRTDVVAAKAVAYALGGAALGLVCAALTAAVAIPVIAAKPTGLVLSGEEIVLLFLGVVLASGLAGALGVGFGALFRSQVAAVIVAVAFFVLVEPLLAAFVEEIALYGPSGALSTLSGSPPLERPSMVVGGVLATVYAAVVLAAGAAVTRRRDIA